jgi:hypothetical protein
MPTHKKEFLMLCNFLRLAAFSFGLVTLVRAQTVEDVYRNLKSLEGRIALPTPQATANVRYAFDYQPPPGRRVTEVVRINKDFAVSADAVNVILRFQPRRPNGFQIEIDGATGEPNRTAGFIDVPIGRARTVNYRANIADIHWTGTITISRPVIVGTGAFLIPALPIAIVYEPPQDAGRRNRAVYMSGESVGNTTGTSLKTENSRTVPVTPTRYVDVQTFRDAITGLATGATIAGATATALTAVGVGSTSPLGDISSVAKTVLGLFADALGQASANWTQGTRTTADYRLTVTAGSGGSLSTGEHLGPGPGDRIVYLRKARLVWLTIDGNVALTLLGSDAVAGDSVAYLRRALGGSLSAAEMQRLPDRRVIQELLELDPFAVHGPTAPLDPGRFALDHTYEGSGLGDTADERTFWHEVQSSDFAANVSFSTRVEDYRSGWLRFLGIGVQQDETLRTDNEKSHIAGTTATASDRYTISFYAPLNQRYAYTVYYDRVFGTYATVEVPLVSGPPWLSGVVTATGGGQLAGELVELIRDGRRYLTRTDAQGRYAFYSRDLKPGTWRFKAGDVERTVEIADTRSTLNVTARPRVILPPPVPRKQ